jgi:hypothetical protein
MGGPGFRRQGGARPGAAAYALIGSSGTFAIGEVPEGLGPACGRLATERAAPTPCRLDVKRSRRYSYNT